MISAVCVPHSILPCLLSFVCCLFSFVFYPLSVVRCPLSVARCPLSVVFVYGVYMSRMVVEQLRCAGVIEAIRISRAGFPNRLMVHELKRTYAFLLTQVYRILTLAPNP